MSPYEPVGRVGARRLPRRRVRGKRSAEGITIEDLYIRLDGDLDLRTFLGLNAANAGYEAITVQVPVASDAHAEQPTDLHERVIGASPVGHTLSRAVPFTGTHEARLI